MKNKAGLEMAAGLILGAVVGNIASKKAGEMLPVVGKYSGALAAVAGFFIMGQKSPIIKAAGAGMLAAGGANLAAAFIPAVSPPINDQVLADAIITDEILPLNEDLSGSEEYLTEDMTEDMTIDMSEDMTEDMN